MVRKDVTFIEEDLINYYRDEVKRSDWREVVNKRL